MNRFMKAENSTKMTISGIRPMLMESRKLAPFRAMMVPSLVYSKYLINWEETKARARKEPMVAMALDMALHTSRWSLKVPTVLPKATAGRKNSRAMRTTMPSIRGEAGRPSRAPFSFRKKELAGMQQAMTITTKISATMPARRRPLRSASVMVVRDSSSSPSSSPPKVSSRGSTILSVTKVPTMVIRKVDTNMNQ